MTYFADLDPFTYLGNCNGEALAVGWLEAEHDHTRGDVQRDVIAALERVFEHAWQPVTTAGWHDCSLCGRKPEDGPITRDIAGKRELLGVKNLLVPAGNRIYAAPSLIIHYIEEHGYRPPDEFITALRALDPTALDKTVEAYASACERIWYGS